MSNYKQYLTQAEADAFLKSVDVNRDKHISLAVKSKQGLDAITSIALGVTGLCGGGQY